MVGLMVAGIQDDEPPLHAAGVQSSVSVRRALRLHTRRELGADLDIHAAPTAAPEDCVSGWWIGSSRIVAAKTGQFTEKTLERAQLGPRFPLWAIRWSRSVISVTVNAVYIRAN